MQNMDSPPPWHQPREGAFELTVQTLMGSVFRLAVTPHTTVGQIKIMLDRQHGVPFASQQLVLRSTLLESDSATLAEAGIGPGGPAIKLVARVAGGPGGFRPPRPVQSASASLLPPPENIVLVLCKESHDLYMVRTSSPMRRDSRSSGSLLEADALSGDDDDASPIFAPHQLIKIASGHTLDRALLEELGFDADGVASALPSSAGASTTELDETPSALVLVPESTEAEQERRECEARMRLLSELCALDTAALEALLLASRAPSLDASRQSSAAEVTRVPVSNPLALRSGASSARSRGSVAALHSSGFQYAVPEAVPEGLLPPEAPTLGFELENPSVLGDLIRDAQRRLDALLLAENDLVCRDLFRESCDESSKLSSTSSTGCASAASLSKSDVPADAPAPPRLGEFTQRSLLSLMGSSSNSVLSVSELVSPDVLAEIGHLQLGDSPSIPENPTGKNGAAIPATVQPVTRPLWGRRVQSARTQSLPNVAENRRRAQQQNAQRPVTAISLMRASAPNLSQKASAPPRSGNVRVPKGPQTRVPPRSAKRPASSATKVVLPALRAVTTSKHVHCDECHVRLTPAGRFSCRCGRLLCSKHRQCEAHRCTAVQLVRQAAKESNAATLRLNRLSASHRTRALS